MARGRPLTCIAVLFCSTAILGQSGNPAQSPSFAAISIKRSTATDGRTSNRIEPGGRYTAVNVPVLLIIRMSHDLQGGQISGGPDWMSRDRYDVVAKADGNPERSVMLAMIRAMLTDRFKLMTHTESREAVAYALVMARRDRAPGRQLTESTTDCAAAARTNPTAFCGLRTTGNTMIGHSVTMAQLAGNLSLFAQRPVLDRTALTGNFDLQLTFEREPSAARSGVPSPAGTSAPSTDASLFTALTEQLGLKLEPAKTTIDVLIIDRLERPTEN